MGWKQNFYDTAIANNIPHSTAAYIARANNPGQALRYALDVHAPAPAAPAAPAAPPAPKPIAPPVQSNSTQAQAGNTVRRPRKSKKKTRLSDLRISRPSINRSLSIGAGGTGLNVGGY